jgi:hypothetical protein
MPVRTAMDMEGVGTEYLFSFRLPEEGDTP